LVDGTFDVVDDTHQDNYTELSIPGSRTHGGAERGAWSARNSLRQGSLAVESRIDPRVVRVIDWVELPMLDQRFDAFSLNFSRNRFQS